MGTSSTDSTESKTIVDEDNNLSCSSLRNSSCATVATTTLDKPSSMPVHWRLGLYASALIVHRLFAAAVGHFVSVCSAVGLILLLVFWFYGGLGTLFLLHVAVLGLLYNAQDMLLYMPDQPAQSFLYVDLPSSLGLPYENVNVKTQDGVQINMFLIKQPANLIGTAPTVIYFHGNAGNIGHRLVNAHGLYNSCKVNILLVEYRGYGRSRGQPSEEGLKLDSQAALDYILSRSDINHQKLVVFGRSLGGAVAVSLCSIPYYASRVAGVLLENTFTSIPEMAQALFKVGIFQYIPEWCFKNKFMSRSLIDKIQIPSLFLCGQKDSLVPPKMMLQLYNLSGSRLKRLAIFQDGNHNDTWQCHGYYEALFRFFYELEQSSHGRPLPSVGTYPVNDARFYEETDE